MGALAGCARHASGRHPRTEAGAALTACRDPRLGRAAVVDGAGAEHRGAGSIPSSTRPCNSVARPPRETMAWLTVPPAPAAGRCASRGTGAARRAVGRSHGVSPPRTCSAKAPARVCDSSGARFRYGRTGYGANLGRPCQAAPCSREGIGHRRAGRPAGSALASKQGGVPGSSPISRPSGLLAAPEVLPARRGSAAAPSAIPSGAKVWRAPRTHRPTTWAPSAATGECRPGGPSAGVLPPFRYKTRACASRPACRSRCCRAIDTVTLRPAPRAKLRRRERDSGRMRPGARLPGVRDAPAPRPTPPMLPARSWTSGNAGGRGGETGFGEGLSARCS